MKRFWKMGWGCFLVWWLIWAFASQKALPFLEGGSVGAMFWVGFLTYWAIGIAYD